mgnify:CR=1 FL=1
MYNNIGIGGLLLLLIVFSPLIIGLLVMGGQKKIILKHQDSGLSKTGFVGYCWTYFFFGFFVPIFRGEIGIGALHFLFSVVTFGLFQLIMPFLYNKQYTSRLLVSGFNLDETDANYEIARAKLGVMA